MTEDTTSKRSSFDDVQYVSLQVSGEQTILYDTEQTSAWIQSDSAVTLDEVQ